MTEIVLELDQRANKSIHELMKHFKINSKAELISKAIGFLKVVAHIDKTEGELFARKGHSETRILVR